MVNPFHESHEMGLIFIRVIFLRFSENFVSEEFDMQTAIMKESNGDIHIIWMKNPTVHMNE